MQVGSHTFNMPSRVSKSAEAEQRVACIGLQGLCMMDSQSGYHPEGKLKDKNSFWLIDRFLNLTNVFHV